MSDDRLPVSWLFGAAVLLVVLAAGSWWLGQDVDSALLQVQALVLAVLGLGTVVLAAWSLLGGRRTTEAED